MQKQNIQTVLEEKHINVESYLNSDNNHFITVLNPLVRACYDLSYYPTKILYFMLSTISSVDDDRLYKISISVADLSKILGFSNNKDIYRRIDKATDELMQKIIKIQAVDDKNKWIKINLMQYCYCDRGKVTLAFSAEMSVYLLNLKKNFTNIPFKYLNQMPTPYASKLLLLLFFHYNCNKNKQKATFATYSVEFLREFFLGDNAKKKYLAFKDFNPKVIKSAIKDINESLLLDVKPTYITTNRKTTAIKFIIKNGEANKAYLDVMQNNKEKRTTEEIERKTDGSAKAAVTYLRNIFHISEKVAKDIIAENDLKTIELKAICVFMQQFLDKKKMSHFFGLQDNDNEYLYYIDPDKIDYTIGHGMALLRIMANNKEEEISCKMLNYNKSLDYEANLQNIAFANSVNKQFEEVYNKHLQTIKELE